MTLRKHLVAAITALTAMLGGCASTQQTPIKPIDHVDLPRFMGAWYVIATIPTFIETDAYNPIESYQLDSDGTIATTFTFNAGSLNGPAKRYTPRGFVMPNTGNGLWGMQFIWPFKGEFIIAHLDADYRTTIIARNARDYVWIMARTPQLTDAEYQSLLKRVAEMGYSLDKIRKNPHAEQNNASNAK
jgi:apolipoprotein D and lipocalin family protein